MSLVSCNKIREIRPTSFELVSVSPKGFYSADVDFKLGIHNPALQIGFSDIFAEVVLNGKVIGNVSVAPFVMEAKLDKVYDINALLTLNKGTSVLNLIPLLKSPDAMKNAHINLRVRATLKNGISKELVWNEVPVEKLIKLVE
jgi:hypothetical protein